MKWLCLRWIEREPPKVHWTYTLGRSLLRLAVSTLLTGVIPVSLYFDGPLYKAVNGVAWCVVMAFNGIDYFSRRYVGMHTEAHYWTKMLRSVGLPFHLEINYSLLGFRYGLADPDIDISSALQPLSEFQAFCKGIYLTKILTMPPDKQKFYLSATDENGLPSFAGHTMPLPAGAMRTCV